MSAELACVEYVDDVIKELEKQIEIAQGSAKANHKVAKVRIFNQINMVLLNFLSMLLVSGNDCTEYS